MSLLLGHQKKKIALIFAPLLLRIPEIDMQLAEKQQKKKDEKKQKKKSRNNNLNHSVSEIALHPDQENGTSY